jgi:hypothetical protein
MSSLERDRTILSWDQTHFRSALTSTIAGPTTPTKLRTGDNLFQAPATPLAPLAHMDAGLPHVKVGSGCREAHDREISLSAEEYNILASIQIPVFDKSLQPNEECRLPLPAFQKLALDI